MTIDKHDEFGSDDDDDDVGPMPMPDTGPVGNGGPRKKRKGMSFRPLSLYRLRLKLGTRNQSARIHTTLNSFVLPLLPASYDEPSPSMIPTHSSST